MPPLGPGSPAPRFRLPRLGGGSIQLDEYLATGPVWLFFMKGSCPTCRVGAPFLERFHREAAGSDARVVVVLEDTAEDARLFAEELGWTLPVAVEESPWPVSAAYGLFTVPADFVIETDGRIVKAGTGFFRLEWNETARGLMARDVAGNAAGVSAGGDELDDYELIRLADGAPEFKPG